jgi:hypothetical protein
VKLTITPTGGTAFLLADGTTAPIVATSWANGAGGLVREGFLNKQRRIVQIQPLFRAAYPFLAARFNWQGYWQFTVQRTFSTAEQCFAFVAVHPDSVPASGEIWLSNNSSTGVINRYLPGAVIETVECIDQKEVACDFLYTIKTNSPWQSSA